MRRLVALRDLHLAAVGHGHRADLILDHVLVGVVSDPLERLGARHGRRDALDVEQRRPHALDRRVDGELVLEAHGTPLYRCRPMASTTASSAATLWPLTRSSTCGRAAAHPPPPGANPGAATRGLPHTIR